MDHRRDEASAGLAPKDSTTYNFVVTAEKPFVSTKVICLRIVLEGGKLADPQKDCQILP